MGAAIAATIAQDEVRGLLGPEGLTPRKVEILGLTASGATVQATANAHCFSPKTVHNTLSVIRGKLGTRNDAISSGSPLGLGSSRR